MSPRKKGPSLPEREANQKAGKSQFALAERIRIVKEADAAPRMQDVADKYKVRLDTLYRWRVTLKRQGHLDSPSTPAPAAPAVPARASVVPDVRRGSFLPAAASSEEVRRLHEIVGKLTEENMILQQELRKRG